MHNEIYIPFLDLVPKIIILEVMSSFVSTDYEPYFPTEIAHLLFSNTATLRFWSLGDTKSNTCRRTKTSITQSAREMYSDPHELRLMTLCALQSVKQQRCQETQEISLVEARDRRVS